MEKKQGKFFDGFFFGAVLGGGVAYVLSTKKGRDFVKELIQDGADLLESVTEPEPEVYEETPEASQEVMISETAPVVSNKPQTEHTAAPRVNHEKKASEKSRFFKKAPKR